MNPGQLDDRNRAEPLIRAVAGRLMDEDSARLWLLLQELKRFGTGASASAAPSQEHPQNAPKSDGPLRRLGVWRIDGITGAGPRVPYCEAWNRFADIPQIPPKGERPRVLLLGESVARAYFFDPAFTVGRIVENCLAANHCPAEIVDLAAVGQDIDDLETVIASCGALRPDCMVVFAGNNWVLEYTGWAEEPGVVASLSAGDRGTARRLILDHILPARIDRFFDRLEHVLGEQGIPGLFVVPEFNLIDYADETEGWTPWIPDGGSEQWRHHYENGQAALSALDINQAADCARAMTRLDNGLHSAAYALLGRCDLTRGDVQSAYGQLAHARDAACAHSRHCTPRCPEGVRLRIKENCHRRSIAVLDLRDVLCHDGGRLDRTRFLDYCHLTATGLRVACGHIANCVSTILSGRSVVVSHCETGIQPVDAAVSHVLAALHNSHTGAMPAIIEYHANEALRLCPDVSALMADILDFTSRATPDWMLASFRSACKWPAVRRYLLTQLRPAKTTIGDPIIECAFDYALSTTRVSHGITSQEQPNASAPTPLDLVPCRRVTVSGYDDARYAHLRAHGFPSVFFLRHRSGIRAWRIRIVWRSAAAVSNCAHIGVNGVVVASPQIGRVWTTAAFSVDASQLRSGLNRVEIYWPPSQELRIADVTWSPPLAVPDFFNVFGEIQEFTAEPVASSTQLTADAQSAGVLMS